MAPFTIGEQTFPTKKAATEEVNRILHGCPTGTALSGGDYTLIRALLDLHPSAAEKIGLGVLGIWVGDSGEYGSRCFHAVRADDSDIDFSKNECLNPSSKRADITAALRWEVQDQLDVVRNQTWYPACELCGKVIITIDEVDVDHADTSFATLRDRLVHSCGGWDSARLGVENDGATRLRLVNRRVAQIWQMYHQTNARLRPLHRACHRGLGR